ncbi:unnamed protein product, partial [Mesorhabditis spiculigera]
MKLNFWIFASLTLLLVDAEPMFPAIPKDESQLCLTIEDCPQTRGKLSHICDIPYGELEGVVLFSQPNSSDIGLFCYPNMANVQTMADLLQVEVYAYDYSGFGCSRGTPGEKNAYADVRAAYDLIRAEQPEKKIVLIGFSIGTAVSTDLAARHPDALAGVALICPFASGLRLLKGAPQAPETRFCDVFPTYDKIQRVGVPVLFLHGTRDQTCPISHSHALHKMLPSSAQPSNPVCVVEGAGHADILSSRYPETFAALWLFIHVQVGPDTTSERQTVVSKVSRPSLYMHLLNVFAEGAQKARRSGDANAANGSSQKTSSSSGSPQEEAA